MLGYELNIETDVDLGGFFIAEVIEMADPKAQERIRVRVIGVHDMDNKDKKNSMWAHHLAPSKSSSGEVPDIGDYVYVSFLQKNPMHLLWHGWCRVSEG
jgi:hypothetical protein